jgi:hypothetical protein
LTIPTYNHHVLNGHRQVGDELLASPLVGRIHLLASLLFCFRVEYPSDDSVVDGNAKERPKDLREKHVSGRNVHVVTDLHVLEVVLSPVPCVAFFQILSANVPDD